MKFVIFLLTFFVFFLDDPDLRVDLSQDEIMFKEDLDSSLENPITERNTFVLITIPEEIGEFHQLNLHPEVTASKCQNYMLDTAQYAVIDDSFEQTVPSVLQRNQRFENDNYNLKIEDIQQDEHFSDENFSLTDNFLSGNEPETGSHDSLDSQTEFSSNVKPTNGSRGVSRPLQCTKIEKKTIST